MRGVSCRKFSTFLYRSFFRRLEKIDFFFLHTYIRINNTAMHVERAAELFNRPRFESSISDAVVSKFHTNHERRARYYSRLAGFFFLYMFLT